MKKIDCAKELIESNINLLSCPICKNRLHINDNQIKCEKNHSFDLSKNGYLNLLLNNKVKTDYGKDLFEARSKVFKFGLFNEATDSIKDAVLNYSKSSDLKKLSILDAGCGEGSHLAKIIDGLDHNKYTGIGLDISKEGIFIAAREHQNIIWAVGDLAETPFSENAFNIILNILSPSNYNEFKKLLTDDGILIKVIPERFHLYELRRVIYDKTDKENYSNEQVIDNFKKSFKIIDVKNSQYKFPLSKDLLSLIIKMTPLTWSADEEKIKEILNSNIKDITIDLSVIIGKT